MATGRLMTKQVRAPCEYRSFDGHDVNQCLDKLFGACLSREP